MTVQKKAVKPQDPTVAEPSINDWKAQAYDEIAQMENYQRLIQQCQQNLQKINEQIIKKKQEEARTSN